MTPERYGKIGELFNDALELKASERAAFLERECAGDSELRREVESLLRSHEAGGGIIDEPALEVAAGLLAGGESEEVVGQTLAGRYRVLSLLGEGGMGRVYLAEDARLGRRVALKLLPEHLTHDAEQSRRFRREARAASALNHPNIITVHDIEEVEGKHLIASEHVEGETLRERLSPGAMPLAEALDVAAQIASALRAAHEAGIVHRDVKPENVMLRRDGYVKVLDFGIAKLTAQRAPAAGAAAQTASAVKTAPGLVVGTDRYMSPEQARGREVDARADVWSLGCVLYEMLSGVPAFAGETTSDVVAAILKTEPAPLPQVAPGVPGELQRIVGKCLEKEREGRYASAKELLADLRQLQKRLEAGDAGAVQSARRRLAARVALPAALALVLGSVVPGLYFYKAGGARPVGDKKSIAVLPLKPIGAANRDEVYEVGVADSLIHRLSSMKGFVVRPLSATRRYATVEQDPLVAGKEQKADYVLASNYQLAAGKIRITAQLFNVASGQVEETYKSEKDAGDAFALQDAVAEEVGRLLLARFATTSSSPKAVRGTSNEEAYRLYLRAMYLLDKQTVADSKRAIELFDQALSLDANYAKAWASKARAHCHYAHVGGSTPDAEFAKARPALERAFALDGDLAEPHAVLGIIKADYDWNLAEGEKHFLRAIELAPNSDTLYPWYAYQILARQGRWEEAIASAKTAVDLNPNYVVHQISYGHILYLARRHDDAITQLERAVEMDSARPYVYGLLWRSYHQKGDHPRAYETLMRLLRLLGTKDETLKNYETLYAKSGWQSVLLRNLENLKANDANGSAAYLIAELSALLGQREQSFLYLNDAVKNRSLQIPNILSDPALNSLRGDPRFAELVGRVESQRR